MNANATQKMYNLRFCCFFSYRLAFMSERSGVKTSFNGGYLYIRFEHI